MGLAVLAIALLASGTSVPDESPACSAAKAAIVYIAKKEGNARPIVMTLGPPSDLFRWMVKPDDPVKFLTEVSRDQAAWNSEHPDKAREKTFGPPPSPETIAAMWAFQPTDPRVVCPGFAPFTAGLGLRSVNERQANWRSQVRSDGLFRSTFVSLNTPVVNSQRTEALAYWGVGYAPRAGHDAMLVLRKDEHGQWYVVQELTVAVS